LLCKNKQDKYLLHSQITASKKNLTEY